MKFNKDALDKILTGIKIICAVFLILLVTMLAIQRFSNNDFALFGYRMFSVATGSMIPVYEVGDVVVVKEVDPATLKVDDDITYLGKEDTFAGKVVTHRIIRIQKSTIGTIFYTQGVANDAPDPTITADQIYGKVVRKSIFMSFLSRLTENMGLFYAVIFVPVGIIMFLQIKDHIDAKYEDDIKVFDDCCFYSSFILRISICAEAFCKGCNGRKCERLIVSRL